jgi:hypothetical protein
MVTRAESSVTAKNAYNNECSVILKSNYQGGDLELRSRCLNI